MNILLDDAKNVQKKTWRKSRKICRSTDSRMGYSQRFFLILGGKNVAITESYDIMH